jgi:hypothetical protein
MPSDGEISNLARAYLDLSLKAELAPQGAVAPIDDYLVTVCSSCCRAACYQGWHCCDNHQNAGTDRKRVSELEALDREHHSYWTRE